jgi:hypothetical protein
MERPKLSGDDVVRMISAWHGIAPPNPAALDFAADLPKVIAAFEALGPADFSAEPSDFGLVLDAFSDQPA